MWPPWPSPAFASWAISACAAIQRTAVGPRRSRWVRTLRGRSLRAESCELPTDSATEQTRDGARSIARRNLVLFGLSVSGYLVLAYIVWWGFSVGQFDVPSGDAAVWDRAGDQVRLGVHPYERAADNSTDSFWYAPPVAVLFAV